jgi:hypothetical protein
MFQTRRGLVAVIMVSAGLVSGCVAQRAEIAKDAQTQMVGMSKEAVLTCMGPPQSKAAEGSTEVWSYMSGGSSASAVVATGYGSVITTSPRYCQVNVVMSSGAVSRLVYQGPSGGLLTPDNECAYAVQNCVKRP